MTKKWRFCTNYCQFLRNPNIGFKEERQLFSQKIVINFFLTSTPERENIIKSIFLQVLFIFCCNLQLQKDSDGLCVAMQ
jgi:hypothetical protein